MHILLIKDTKKSLDFLKSQIKAVVGEERHLHYTVCRREVDNMPEFASNYDLIFILGSSDITMNNYQTS